MLFATMHAENCSWKNCI